MNKKIGLCHGVFDLVHIGHIEHFKYAKSMVDILICSVTNDNFVNKGPGKPIYSVRDRVSVLKSLNFFDDVIISNSETAEQVIKKIKPNIYFKGEEYRENSKDLSKNIVKEIKAIKKIKGKIVYTDTKVSSSSLISNTYFDFINHEAKKYITKFKANEFLEKVEKNLLKKNKKKFLLIGEPIIDNNIFVKPSGKSNKNNIISSQFIDKKAYAGGSLLVANFLKSFNCEFDFVLPWNNDNSKIFKKYLNQKINIIKIKSNSKVINKTRFIDNYNYQKLYQYSKNENSIYWKEYSNEAYRLLKNKIKNYSYIVILDYGYGLFSENFMKFINRQNKKKLFINCQTNSFNYGFNIISKFKRANTACIDEMEYRLLTKFRTGDVNKENLKENKKKFESYEKFVVTQGKKGSIIKFANRYLEHPSILNKIVDTNGCGDVFFSMLFLSELKDIKNINHVMTLSHVASGLHASEISNKPIVVPSYFFKILRSVIKL